LAAAVFVAAGFGSAFVAVAVATVPVFFRERPPRLPRRRFGLCSLDSSAPAGAGSGGAT
jgi:hypothetical protein